MQTEELQARLAAIVATSDDAIISKNLDGVILSWNSAAERIFGYTADEIVGRPILVLLPTERFEEEETILTKIRRGEWSITLKLSACAKTDAALTSPLQFRPSTMLQATSSAPRKLPEISRNISSC